MTSSEQSSKATPPLPGVMRLVVRPLPNKNKLYNMHYRARHKLKEAILDELEYAIKVTGFGYLIRRMKKRSSTRMHSATAGSSATTVSKTLKSFCIRKSK